MPALGEIGLDSCLVQQLVQLLVVIVGAVVLRAGVEEDVQEVLRVRSNTRASLVAHRPGGGELVHAGG